jgi:N-acetylmuramoyl-L-alanine amidase
MWSIYESKSGLDPVLLASVQMRRSLPRVTLTLTLSLAAFIAVVILSTSTARAPVATGETVAPAGPVCFYQYGYPTCVERPGADALTAPDAVTPEALMAALLAGPTDGERARGIESAIPPGTRLASVQTDGRAVTVRLILPAAYLTADRRPPAAFDALASEAIAEQVFKTLFPLGYRDFYVEAEDPSAPGTFRPLSDYLPPVIIPAKASTPDTEAAKASTPDTEAAKASTPDTEAAKASTPDTEAVLRPVSQPPVEVKGRPQGALSGKTIYVSAGHGWWWNGSNWRTQRPPYPDASTGYVGPIIEDHNNAEVVNQYLLRYLWNAGADVWTARERDLNTFEQVIDDGSSGFATSGSWETVGTGGYAAHYLQTTTSLAATAAVTWTTDPPPADGVYALYVWYVPGSDRAGDAHYTVYHAGGATGLTVDQRHHGHTWRYVGRFPLRAGERLTVSLSNQSATSGQVVVADAVRLGGGTFDSLAGIATEAPCAPDKPWWETAARYHVQRLGVDPDDYAYFNDVVARPFWARWEHANTGDDAVYVSWHTNGLNGHNTTFWGTSSFIHSYQPVTGSAALRDAIHNELVNDARAGWDPAWRDAGKGSMDAGELRELWDSDPANAIPGALIEIAYHDHVGDTDALKDPRFALLSARAVYQGMVKYFEARDGVDLTLLPEPPTHLTVRNGSTEASAELSRALAEVDGPGRVTLNWRASPTDGVGLVGDAAESYRVYTSRDGLGWDNGQAVVGTSYTFTGLQENELIFVRVTAVNAGGESFPTPILAARTSPDGVGRVLLVDGFDRVDRYGLILENDPVEGTNARLFPDQINSFDYLIEHGEAVSFPFDSAANEAVADGSTELAEVGDLSLTSYGVVDWILGEESSVDHTFDAAEQAAVAAYLNSGGALFVSGAEIGWDLVHKGNGPAFYQTCLGADWVGDDAGTYLATPTAGGIFAGLGSIEFRENYDADYPDQLATRSGSIAALDYVGGGGGVAAIQYDAGGCRRVVYLGFPFETIAAPMRTAVMARVFDYLGADGCLFIPPHTTITTPVSGGAFNTVPGFAGKAAGFNPIERVEVQISDPDGRYWDGQGWVSAPRWLTAVGRTAWSYPLPPSVLSGTTPITTLNQGEHRLWARAWDTATLSDTTPAFASFIFDTISPTTPTLITPTDGLTVTGAPAAFLWRGPVGDAGSALSYNLQIDDQVLTQAITSYVPSRWLANGLHTWRVRAFDAAGNRSPWTAPWSFTVIKYEFYLPAVYKEYTTP